MCKCNITTKERIIEVAKKYAKTFGYSEIYIYYFLNTWRFATEGEIPEICKQTAELIDLQ